MSAAILLAQLGNFLNPDVAPLPEPSAFQRFVLEQPTLPAVVLMVLGVVAFFAIRGSASAKHAPTVLFTGLAFAGLVFAAGSLVQTDRERLIDRQDALIDAIAAADIPTLDRMLAPDARVRGVQAPFLQDGLGREQILGTVRSILGERYDVSTVGRIERQAVIDGPNAARTQVYVRVATENAGQTWAWFLIGWRLDPGASGEPEWKVIEIEPLFISGVLSYNG